METIYIIIGVLAAIAVIVVVLLVMKSKKTSDTPASMALRAADGTCSKNSGCTKENHRELGADDFDKFLNNQYYIAPDYPQDQFLFQANLAPYLIANYDSLKHHELAVNLILESLEQSMNSGSADGSDPCDSFYRCMYNSLDALVKGKKLPQPPKPTPHKPSNDKMPLAGKRFALFEMPSAGIVNGLLNNMFIQFSNDGKTYSYIQDNKGTIDGTKSNGVSPAWATARYTILSNRDDIVAGNSFSGTSGRVAPAWQHFVYFKQTKYLMVIGQNFAYQAWINVDVLPFTYYHYTPAVTSGPDASLDVYYKKGAPLIGYQPKSGETPLSELKITDLVNLQPSCECYDATEGPIPQPSAPCPPSTVESCDDPALYPHYKDVMYNYMKTLDSDNWNVNTCDSMCGGGDTIPDSCNYGFVDQYGNSAQSNPNIIPCNALGNNKSACSVACSALFPQ